LERENSLKGISRKRVEEKKKIKCPIEPVFPMKRNLPNWARGKVGAEKQ